MAVPDFIIGTTNDIVKKLHNSDDFEKVEEKYIEANDLNELQIKYIEKSIPLYIIYYNLTEVSGTTRNLVKNYVSKKFPDIYESYYSLDIIDHVEDMLRVDRRLWRDITSLAFYTYDADEVLVENISKYIKIDFRK